ncbi:MAG: MBL fold metallo-hydrolase [Bacilli bacterium]|jgi:glyoxylase-like metal-dependent hydrolase (beta-lactamase superfamily II)
MKITKLYFKHNCNAYAIGDKNGPCILIDPGYNKNGILDKYLSRNYASVELVLLTHGHYDHFSGLRNLKNVENMQIVIHQDDAEKLDDPRTNCSTFDNDEIILQANPHLVHDGETIKSLGLTIIVIHTPFHTSGSVCFYIPELRALFSGDTLFHLSIGRSDLPTSSARNIQTSLDKLKKLPPDTIVYPGHGETTTIKNELLFNEYMKK